MHVSPQKVFGYHGCGQVAELAVGLSTHTPALQSIPLPGKSRKSAGQEDWNLKSQDSANISLLTPSSSRGVTAARPHKTQLKEIPEASKVHPEQQADKFWCHRGELRQHLTKWNCSIPVQLPNVSLGKGSSSIPCVLSPPSPQNPAGHCYTNRCCRRITLAAMLSGDFWKLTNWRILHILKARLCRSSRFAGCWLQGGQSWLCVCLNRLALAGKLSTERVKRENQLLWCNPGPAARDPSPSSLPGGLSSITSGPWHC